MLTPKQIKNHEFQLAGRNAYRASDVDDFMAELCESYEQMFRENAELVKKLSLLADKVSEYKNDEDNIRNALLMAERMKDSILAEAQDKAKAALAATEVRVRAAKDAVDEKTAVILQNANDEAEKIISDANSRAEDTLKLAQSNATKLLAKAQEIYDEQVSTIKDEAEKEQAYLNRIKAESVKVRMELLDTYKTQMQILEYTPDFSEEVSEMHKKNALPAEDDIIEASKETDFGEDVDTGTAEVSENEDEISDGTFDASEEDSNDVSDDLEGDLEDDLGDGFDDEPEDDEEIAIVLESVDVADDYLIEDEYVSLPEDETEYNDEEDEDGIVYAPDDMDLQFEDSDEEGDLTLF